MVGPGLCGVALAAWGRPISSTNNVLAVYSSLGLPLDEQAFNFLRKMTYKGYSNLVEYVVVMAVITDGSKTVIVVELPGSTVNSELIRLSVIL